MAVYVIGNIQGINVVVAAISESRTYSIRIFVVIIITLTV